MIRTIVFAGAALLTLAGCGGASDGETAAARANATAALPLGNAATPVAAPSGQPRLLLAADGLTPGGTPAARIAFGANSLDTIEAITPLLGTTYDRDESSECGAGPSEFANWGPLVLTFRQGEFVAWEMREPPSATLRIGTAGGAAVGTSRAALAGALGAPVTVEQTSLGTEFSGGGVHGLLDGDTPAAKVTALWAGETCVMR